MSCPYCPQSPICREHPNIRGRRWTLTVNNWTEDMLQTLKTWNKIKYAVIGQECGENQTPHLQVYLILKDAVKKSSILGLIPCWAHRALPGNTAMQKGIQYCKKEGNFEEVGTMPQQGKRTDLATCAEMICAGASLGEIAAEYPTQVVRYHQGLQALRRITVGPSPAWRQLEVTVLYGPTGTGKTRRALESDSVYMWDSTDGWWDGYVDQRRLVIDEMPREGLDFKQLLRILDGHPLMLKVKGGFAHAHYTEVVLTSNFPWTTWYGQDQHLAALERRIHNVIKMD